MTLEKQIATEKEFDEYILKMINSQDNSFESREFFEDYVQKELLKKQGINLEFYKEGEKVYYSFKANIVK